MAILVEKLIYPAVRSKAESELVKARIIHHLAGIAPDTMLGLAFRRFASDARHKTDEDFQELLLTIYTQITEDPLVTRKVLGIHYRFFRKLFC